MNRLKKCKCGNYIIPKKYRSPKRKIDIPDMYLSVMNDESPQILYCQECFSSKYGKLQRGMSKEQKKWMYGVDDDYVNTDAKKFAITLEKLTKKYGTEAGTKAYKQYLTKQAETNTYEYKKAKYGMTREEFDLYNKGRAVTLDNMIGRYGEQLGREKFENYVELQRTAGCSLKYFQNLLGDGPGLTKFNQVNESKSNNLPSFIKKYGEQLGREKYTIFMDKKRPYTSKMADDFFKELYEYENQDDNIYTGFLNNEYGVMGENNYFKYDYVNITKGKVIEFNGNIWHANPLIYEASDTPNPFNKTQTASEIWNKDKIKLDTIKYKRGFEVLEIWETDIVNRKNIIEKCLEFLNKEKDGN